MDVDQRDLAFLEWNRGHEPSRVYGSSAIFDRLVDSDGNVLFSRWIRDNANVVEQMRKPLPNFEFPVSVPMVPLPWEEMHQIASDWMDTENEPDV